MTANQKVRESLLGKGFYGNSYENKLLNVPIIAVPTGLMLAGILQ